MEQKNKIPTGNVILGIDASRNRSGGAKSHLIGVLLADDPRKYGINKIHLWSFRSLLEMLPDKPWLIKHNPSLLEGNIAQQIYWQKFKFSRELKQNKCTILLNTSAGSFSKFKPCITMSREMMCYEQGEMQRYGWSLMRWRLMLLRYLQNMAFQHASGVIFLTNYAKESIQKSCGQLNWVTCIPHGVGQNFKSVCLKNAWPKTQEQPIECIYISNTDLYKHQWVVVRSIIMLVHKGYNVRLTLIGGGAGKAQKLLDKQIKISDPQELYIKQTGFVPQSELPGYLSRAHLFVFASSCENMPNTLLEAMAAGLPIACSNRGPMPELLQNAGVYFNPEDDCSIVQAIQKIITDQQLRHKIALEAKALANQYDWLRCAKETWQFVTEIYRTIE